MGRCVDYLEIVSFSCRHSKILSLEANNLVELHCLHTFPSQSTTYDILGN